MSRAVSLSTTRHDAVKNARKWLENHKVYPEGADSWRFQRPPGEKDSYFYWARIVRKPYMLMMYGDMGEVIFRPNAEDALSWLRKVIGQESGYDLSYIAEKVPAALLPGVEEYRKELVTAHLSEVKEEARENLSEVDETLVDLGYKQLKFVNEMREFGEFENEHEFLVAWYQEMNRAGLTPDEPPDTQALTYRFTFQVEAFRIFFEKVDAQLLPVHDL